MVQGFGKHFGIDVALQGQGGECVAYIVETYLRAAHFLHDLLEVDVQRLEPHEVPVTALRSGNILLDDHTGGCVLYEKREQVEALLNQSKAGTTK